MTKVSIRVFGRVQGVGFRFMTKIAADKIGVQGIVRNQPDGSVYIEASGPQENVERFIQAVKKSPSPSGKVDSCKIEYSENLPDYQSFDVLYS